MTIDQSHTKAFNLFVLHWVYIRKEAASDVGHQAKEATDKLKAGTKSVFNKMKGKA
jgi:hypothetical protein